MGKGYSHCGGCWITHPCRVGNGVVANLGNFETEEEARTAVAEYMSGEREALGDKVVNTIVPKYKEPTDRCNETARLAYKSKNQ